MNQIVQFQAPRLPYHDALAERFGVDKSGWKVLCEAVFPAAEKPDSIVMALAYCKARNLDIFKKPVQIVPIYDKKRGGMVDTVWPGISELRTTAMRTGSFAGFDETEFGPMIEATLSGVPVVYPEWAQCIVYRLVAGQRVPFIGPKTFWVETYATAKRDTSAPNSMWKKRPRGQLEKCAEAAALRRAFPEELGNEYAAEEVAGQSFREVRDSLPQPSGVMARLPGNTNGDGFSASNMDQLEHPATADEIDAVLEGDAIPEFEPSADDAETISSAARVPTEPNKPVGEGLTLAQRVEAFKARCTEATTVLKLRSIGDNQSASALRKDLDAQDPDELAALEAWFGEREAAMEQIERDAAK